MTDITLHDNQWRIAGDVLKDDANAILVQSQALALVDGLNIDFSAVTNADTTALSLMMEWLRRANALGLSITFSGLPESLISLADLHGVTEFIPLSAS